MGQTWGRPSHTLNSPTSGNAFKVCFCSWAHRENGNSHSSPSTLQWDSLNIAAVIVALLQIDGGQRNATSLETSSLPFWSDPSCTRCSSMWQQECALAMMQEHKMKWELGAFYSCVGISTHMMTRNCWAVPLLSECLQHGITDMARHESWSME